MSEHNMRHMEFLEAVATADVEHVREKEATYQGSWKRAGGRSAWFMLRRKIDRLLVMMAPPEPVHGFSLPDLDAAIKGNATLEAPLVKYLRDCYVAEDVFAKIADAPNGADGTVLAELRDLRRYLLLVEAEMGARGVVVHYGGRKSVAVPLTEDPEEKPYDEYGSGLGAVAVPLTEENHYSERKGMKVERRVPRVFQQLSVKEDEDLHEH